MGSLTFDFLKPSVLLNPSDIDNEYRRLSDEELRGELRRYREHCDRYEAELRQELPSEPTMLTVFCGRDVPSITALKQDALYVNTHIIDDPIYAHTYEPSEMHRHASVAVQGSTDDVDRPRLAAAAQYVNALTPAVAADYVKFLPVSRLFEPPEQPTINLPKNGYEDILPPELLSFFKDNALTSSMVREHGGWIIKDELVPARGLFITFREHPSAQGHVFHLFDTKAVILDEEKKIVQFEQSLPDSPPNLERFTAWMRQSINAASRDFFDSTVREIAYAELTNATYLTTSPFVDQLLGVLGHRPTGIVPSTASAVANFQLPVVQNVDLATLMRIREEESVSFLSLRVELERRFREIRLESDPARVRAMTENAFHEITHCQVHDANLALARARRGALADILLAAGGLAASVITSGLSLVAVAVAGVHGYKAWRTVRDIKVKPAYLFRRLLRGPHGDSPSPRLSLGPMTSTTRYNRLDVDLSQ